MANIFLLSDTHFGHAGMLTFVSHTGFPVRKFSCVEEMDEHIVDMWNKTVRAHDHVYHLGDVAMRKSALGIVKRLSGRKRLVAGNHDIFALKDYLACGFEKICGVRVLDNWLMTHIPVHPESLGRFRGNVHGHIHDRPSYGERYVNVSVEAINYTPVALESLRTRNNV